MGRHCCCEAEGYTHYEAMTQWLASLQGSGTHTVPGVNEENGISCGYLRQMFEFVTLIKENFILLIAYETFWVFL